MTVGPAVDHARPANLRRVSSRTSLKRSCSAPTLTPVWEPDSEAEHEVARLRAMCSDFMRSGMYAPNDRVVLLLEEKIRQLQPTPLQLPAC